MVSYIGLTIITLIMLGGGFFFLIERYASQADELITEQKNQQILTQVYHFMRDDPDIGELKLFIENLERVQGVSVHLVDETGKSIFAIYAPSAIFTLDITPEITKYLRLDEPRNNNGFSQKMNNLMWGFLLRNQNQRDRESQQLLQQLLGQGVLQFSVAGVPQAGTITIETKSFFKEQLLRPSRIAFTFAAVVVLVLSIIIGWKISDSLTRPLRSLSSVVDTMSSGNLKARAKTTSKDDEINTLAVQINQLAGDLDGTIIHLQQEKERLQRFLVDASHELRTPVTALSAYLELLTGKAGDDESRRKEYIATCIIQNARSRDIIVHLLELLRLEQLDEKVPLRKLPAQYLLDEAVAMMKPAADEKHIYLTIGDPCINGFIFGDKYQLETALKNILENAVKYSPNGSDISCGCVCSKGHVCYTIKDSGMGIDPEEIDRVFDRFYRSKKAQCQGSGLGLSIVKQIVMNHKGTIMLENRTDGSGLSCMITFPVA